MKTATSGLTFFILLFAILPLFSHSQDTFSICAVDPATGQVGSAGATCIASAGTSAIIISDVHPGVGVVHTQASWLSANQVHARNYMNQGLTPQQIVDSMVAHDFQNNPNIRQYGVVSLDSGGLSAGFSGINCMNYKNHITGPTYAIQGNILLGQQILDSMESRFLNTPGNLACKLMAALQGAKVIGADTRCTPNGISSYSAFIRVANQNDSANNLFLDITVNTYPSGGEPIDSLQTLFNLWGGCASSFIPTHDGNGIRIFPNPVNDLLMIESTTQLRSAEVYNTTGRLMNKIDASINSRIDFHNLGAGIYFLRVTTSDGNLYTVKIVRT